MMRNGDDLFAGAGQPEMRKCGTRCVMSASDEMRKEQSAHLYLTSLAAAASGVCTYDGEPLCDVLFCNLKPEISASVAQLHELLLLGKIASIAMLVLANTMTYQEHTLESKGFLR